MPFSHFFFLLTYVLTRISDCFMKIANFIEKFPYRRIYFITLHIDESWREKARLRRDWKEEAIYYNNNDWTRKWKKK